MNNYNVEFGKISFNELNTIIIFEFIYYKPDIKLKKKTLKNNNEIYTIIFIDKGKISHNIAILKSKKHQNNITDTGWQKIYNTRSFIIYTSKSNYWQKSDYLFYSSIIAYTSSFNNAFTIKKIDNLIFITDIKIDTYIFHYYVNKSRALKDFKNMILIQYDNNLINKKTPIITINKIYEDINTQLKLKLKKKSNKYKHILRFKVPSLQQIGYILTQYVIPEIVTYDNPPLKINFTKVIDYNKDTLNYYYYVFNLNDISNKHMSRKLYFICTKNKAKLRKMVQTFFNLSEDINIPFDKIDSILSLIKPVYNNYSISSNNNILSVHYLKIPQSSFSNIILNLPKYYNSDTYMSY